MDGRGTPRPDAISNNKANNVVTPRILQTRRLGAGTAQAPATRRRRSSARPLVEIATTAAAQRLQLSVFARAYAVSGVLLALAIAYLVVAAQATQNAYVLSQLKIGRASCRERV